MNSELLPESDLRKIDPAEDTQEGLFTIHDSPAKLLTCLLWAFPFAEQRSGSGCSGLRFASVLIILCKGIDSAPARFALAALRIPNATTFESWFLRRSSGASVPSQ